MSPQRGYFFATLVFPAPAETFPKDTGSRGTCDVGLVVLRGKNVYRLSLGYRNIINYITHDALQGKRARPALQNTVCNLNKSE